MAVVDAVRARTKTLQLERPGITVNTDGFATKAVPAVSTIEAHAQPLSPKEVRDLEPGQNATAWRNIWSETEMKVSDVITSSGKKYTIKRVEYWEEGLFYRAQGVITEDLLS